MPIDYSGLMALLQGSANDPIKLAALRDKIIGGDDLSERDPNSDAGSTIHGLPGATAGVQEEADTDPFTGKQAQADNQKSFGRYQDLSTFLSPQETELASRDVAGKAAINAAPAQAAAAGGLATEHAKTEGALQLEQDKRKGTLDLMQQLNGGGQQGEQGGAALGAPGAFKPSINAEGGVSFTETAMPALMQRAHSQLGDAQQKTLAALDEAEKMYPGINDAATKADQQPNAPGWGSFLTGMGGQKYGSATDMAGAANDRLKYTVGVPTPFSKLAQEASFGNIEQMAGQLPGVRGLATITPMFKEHQSRWGHETPLATVQRLRHMAAIMDQTIGDMEHGAR